ncbi:hypothetical protein [Butyrivibrio sp. XPD2002]|uniref:hypothetical protein n=1 Tax=Butyrivibrio sp. XPD2002 TaxID=1280665 RepID=UPI0003F8EF01|nr:hypothetical protein [Butyrivibrio sp. XPD2002]
MKYSFDTYPLYKDESRFAFVVRAKLRMKEPVDIDVMRVAANKAIKRYPYFAVKVEVDESGSYVRVPNDKEVAVLPMGDKTPLLGSKEANGHLLFLECDGKDIYFNISHTMCGGRGLQPWIMTTLWQYVADKYGVEPNAPSIRKPGEPLLDGEMDEPTLDMLPKDEPIYEYASKNPHVLIFDYLNALLNPFARNDNYRLLTFNQKDIMTYAKGTDSSVAAFFLVAVAKALDGLLPAKVAAIGGEMAHNLSANIGMGNAHCDVLSHIHIDYTREQLKMDMEKLGTMTRGQIILQTDPTVSTREIRGKLGLYEKLDGIKGIKAKKKYMKENDPSTGKGAKHGTYYVNYTGQLDWGEVADYIESFAAIVEGHVMLEVTSVGDKIFVCFMQMLSTDKYINAFCDVLKELGIPFTMEGPFPKKLSRHQLPVT